MKKLFRRPRVSPALARADHVLQSAVVRSEPDDVIKRLRAARNALGPHPRLQDRRAEST